MPELLVSYEFLVVRRPHKPGRIENRIVTQAEPERQAHRNDRKHDQSENEGRTEEDAGEGAPFHFVPSPAWCAKSAATDSRRAVTSLVTLAKASLGALPPYKTSS